MASMYHLQAFIAVAPFQEFQKPEIKDWNSFSWLGDMPCEEQLGMLRANIIFIGTRGG